MSSVLFRRAALVAALVMSVPALAADPILDPGLRERELRRSLEREQDRQQEPVRAPVVEEDAGIDEDAEAGPTFLLTSVRFTQSDYLSRDQLADAIAPWLGRQVSFADLQRMVAAINALYRDNGVFTATAVLPKQRIEDGVVLVRLVEGTLGELMVEDNEYTDATYIRRWIRHQDFERTIDVTTLEGDIMLYNRINDQRLQAELRAGEAFGLTDIVVRVSEPRRDSLQVFTDNYGYESTGEAELGALYRRQRLLVNGDRSLLYAQVSEGTRAISSSYNAPLGMNGWRAGGSLSFTQTEVVKGDFNIADVEGQSVRLGAEASRLFLSRQKYWANLLLAASSVQSNTEIAGGADLSKYRIDTAQIGLQFNWLGERWQITLREMVGNSQVDDRLLSEDADILIHDGSLTTVYQLGGGFYALMQAAWQLTDDRGVPGTLAYSLGGPSNVRGYRPGVTSGDRGEYGQLELHYSGWQPAGQPLDLYVFYDAGQTKSVAGTQRLQSAGGGFSAAFGKRWSLDMTAGRALRTVVPDQDDWSLFARLACHCL